MQLPLVLSLLKQAVLLQPTMELSIPALCLLSLQPIASQEITAQLSSHWGCKCFVRSSVSPPHPSKRKEMFLLLYLLFRTN